MRAELWTFFIATALFLLVTSYAATNFNVAQAQTKPFSVYQTEHACVYVAGGAGGNIAIAVLPVGPLGC